MEEKIRLSYGDDQDAREGGEGCQFLTDQDGDTWEIIEDDRQGEFTARAGALTRRFEWSGADDYDAIEVDAPNRLGVCVSHATAFDTNRSEWVVFLDSDPRFEEMVRRGVGEPRAMDETDHRMEDAGYTRYCFDDLSILDEDTYTIRRPGCTAWAEHVPASKVGRELRHANNCVSGHIIVSDISGEVVPLAELEESCE